MIDILTKVAVETWQVFLAAAPYMMIGLVAAMIIHAFFPKDRVESVLGKPGLGSILKASLLGIPLPLCSCGVLPTALSLRDQGASRGATVSFLVSTPETGMDSIAVTYALINPAMTVLRPVAAFISAVVAGLGVERLVPREDKPEEPRAESCHRCCCSTEPKQEVTRLSLGRRLTGSMQYIVSDFFPDIANWLLLGFVLSGIVAAFVPNHFLLGIPAGAQLLLTVLAGVPIYICASASTPIAAVLMAKGLTPGAALVFLLVGPATNFASFLVIGRRLGFRTASVYLTSLAIVALTIGLGINMLTNGWDWAPNISSPTLHEHFGVLNWIGAGVLIIGFLYAWTRSVVLRVRRREAPPVLHEHQTESVHAHNA